MIIRKECTAENPMPVGDRGWWIHWDSKETDYDSELYIEYKCTHCGHVFRTEMPD